MDWIRFALFCGLSFLAVMNEAVCSIAPDSSGKLFFTGGYAFGRFIDIDQNYGNVGWLYFQPLQKDKTILFQDTQFYFLHERDWCLSAGLGARRYFRPVGGFLGANLYYDRRSVYRSNGDLNRVGAGLEYISSHFEARVNGYLPVGTQTSRANQAFEIVYPGGFSATLRNTQIAIWGVDGEAGYRTCKWRGFYLYGAGGFYNYGVYKANTLRYNSFAGTYGRARLSWNDYINLELRASHDPVFSGRVEGVFSIQFPFEVFTKGLKCYCPTACEKIWTRPVFRHGILATVDCCCFDSWSWDSPPSR